MSFLNFHSNLVEGFRIDLETFLDLAARLLESKYQAGLLLNKKPLTFILPKCMIKFNAKLELTMCV